MATEIWKSIENEKGIFQNRKERLIVKEAGYTSGERNPVPVGVVRSLERLTDSVSPLL